MFIASKQTVEYKLQNVLSHIVTIFERMTKVSSLEGMVTLRLNLKNYINFAFRVNTIMQHRLLPLILASISSKIKWMSFRTHRVYQIWFRATFSYSLYWNVHYESIEAMRESMIGIKLLDETSIKKLTSTFNDLYKAWKINKIIHPNTENTKR